MRQDSYDNRKDIIVPEHHYVGFQYRKQCVPLGYMVPDGTDTVALRRKASVDHWSKNSFHSANAEVLSRTFENKAMSEFRIKHESKRTHGLGKGLIYWQIEDPRGFELEISCQNLTYILSNSSVECGEILDKCIWARSGAENVLVPVSSDLYKNAVTNTIRASRTVTLRNVKPGNRIITHDGIEGVYFGKLHLLSKSYNGTAIVELCRKKRAVIAEMSPDGECAKLHITSTLKVSEVLDDSRKELGDCAVDVCRYFQDSDKTKIYGFRQVIGATAKNDQGLTTTSNLIEKDVNDILSDLRFGRYYNWIIVENTAGKFALSSSYELRRSSHTKAVEIDRDVLCNQALIKYIGDGSNMLNRYSTISIDCSALGNYKFYIVDCKVITSEGCELNIVN